MFEKIKRIFTHAGIFHADDCFAIVIAYLACGFKPTVERVRELPKDFNPEEDLAVDVGGVFYPQQNIYDHHFKGGNSDNMAATGKLWSVVGEMICGSKRVADRVYLTLLGSIDRADLGILDWTPVSPEWRHVSMSQFISGLNPSFGTDPKEVRHIFAQTIKFCEMALKNAISQAKEFIEMQDIVGSASWPYPEVLVLQKGGQWKEHVCNDSNFESLLYVIFPSDRGGYNIQCVPPSSESFKMRKPLPEVWAGLRGEQLNNILGNKLTVSSSLFCHDGRFIGGAETLEETLELAKIAIQA